MKKSFIYAGAILAATISLTNCTKEINSSEAALPEGIPFEICANPTTKTTIDGLSTNWVAGDGINVFHAAAGSTSYVSDNEFTIAGDLTEGRFAGKLSDALGDGTYDWYAIYPYSEHIVSPANTSTGYSYIGSRSDKSQSQTGVDNMSHIAGENYPLYGKSTAPTSASEMPSINMKPAFSVLRVKVTNTTESALDVSNISFTAPEAIVGTFYIDFSGDAAVYTDGNYVSEKASLAVTEASIAAGASADFYLAVKPFTAPDGSSLALSVNGYEKELTLTKAIAFAAGHIKTINFNYNVTQTAYIWDLSIDSTTEATAEKIAWTNSVADMECTQGEGGTAANNYYPGASNRTSTRFYSKSTLSITPKDGKSLTYYVFEATTEGYATVLANSTWTNAVVNVVGTTVTVIAKDPSVAVSAAIGNTCGFTKVECHTDPAPTIPPAINASPDSFIVEADGDVCTINYSIDFPVDGNTISATSDQDWVNTFDYSTPGKISFAVDANTGDARTATITLSYKGAENVTITVAQKSASSGETTSTTIEFTPSDFSGKGTTGTGSEVSVTKDGVTVSSDKGYGATQFRVYSGGTLSVSSTVGNITKIEFTFSAKDYSGGLSTTTSYTKEYVEATTTASFSMTKQARITSLKITVAK